MQRRRRLAALLVFVMLVPLLSPVVSGSMGPVRTVSSPAITVTPLGGGGGVSAGNVTSVLVLDNHTVTGGSLNLGTVWTALGDNGSQYAHDHGAGFSTGTHDRTNGLLRGGRLSLASPAADEDIEDFENPVLSPSGWLAAGSHDRVWSTHNLSASNVGTSLPSSAFEGDRVLLLGGPQSHVEGNMAGCYVTPQLVGPSIVRHLNISFQSAAAMMEGDLRWLEWRSSASTSWALLSPDQGYPDQNQGGHATNLTPDPSNIAYAWASNQSTWTTHEATLDGLLPSGTSWFQVRFCFATSTVLGQREGWMIDDLQIVNQGDPGGAWFHGNLSGEYAPNADGWLMLDVNLSNLTAPSELAFRSNWDLEGGWNDGLTTLLSLDGGLNWTLLSTAQGLPGNGMIWQGGWISQESGGWVDIGYSLPPAVFSSGNASSAMLAFRVLTDGSVNRGNGQIDGWEGIAIDDLRVITRPGQANQSVRVLSNFTDGPVLGQGVNLSNTSAANEWAWTSTLGANGPSFWNASFETGRMVPRGWSIEQIRGEGWEVGTLPSTTTSGPTSWTSGSQGVGIVLDGDYVAESLAYLVSPTYSIPENASARLTFRSWVCTETDWDGGALQVSTDDGATWWFPPYDALIHHGRSTLNPYSPLHLEGIFDGSIHTGGCPTRSQNFDAPALDVSNLSGQDFRARFVFFSDTWIEKDGWYLDDVGVEVDRFLPEGNWTSPVLTAPHGDMWGLLDGSMSVPNGTNLHVGLLHANGTELAGWQNLSLPVHVTLDPTEHPRLRVRVHLSTTDERTTPILERLTLGSVAHVDAAHLPDPTPSSLFVDQLGKIRLGVGTSATLSFAEPPVCPHRRASVVLEGTGATLVAPGAVQNVVTNASWGQSIDLEWTDVRLQPSIEVLLTPGDVLQEARLELDCLSSASGVRIGLDSQAHLMLDASTLGFGGQVGASTRFASTVNSSSGASLWSGSASTLNTTALAADAVRVSWWIQADATMGPVAQPYRLVADAGQAGRLLEVQDQRGTRTLVSGVDGQVLLTGVAFCSASSGAPTAHARTCSVVLEGLDAPLAGLERLFATDAAQTRSVPVPLGAVDGALSDRRNVTASSTYPLEVWVSTEYGAVDVALTLESQPRLFESIQSVPQIAWTPEQTVTVVTEHRREDPRDAQAEAPPLVEARLFFGPDAASPLVSVHVDRLDEPNPVFRQDTGAGLASIEASSSASCDRTSCTITWRLTSTWSLEDQARLVWWTFATDEEGFSTGPVQKAMAVSGNDIENDVEVVDLKLFDDRGRALHDWTLPTWPIEIGPSTPLEVQGRLRMEGIAQRFPGNGTVELDVSLTGGSWNDIARITVGEGGHFSGSLTSPLPGDVVSGTPLKVNVAMARCGPTASPSTTCFLRGELPNVTVVHDDAPPSLISLEVLDPGGRQPANGHVAPSDSDLALVLSLEDDLGLASPVIVWTWLESRDDENGDGLSDADEWVAMQVPLAEGRTNEVLDLPLLQASNIVVEGTMHGRARFVIEAEDIAGQALPGGGSKQGQPLAEVRLEPRFPTSVRTESLSLDASEGRLFPGHWHTFSLQLSDANGLDSLDSIELWLQGEDLQSCFIVHQPRSNTTSSDATCFHGAPELIVSQSTTAFTWDIDIGFRLRWDLVASLAGLEHVPSLIVRDEGQDLGLGLRRIAPLTWHATPGIELQLLEALDTTAPIGSVENGVLHVDRGDIVSLRYEVLHQGTTLVAERLPPGVDLAWSMSDGARERSEAIDVPSDGKPVLRMAIDSTVFIRTEGSIVASIEGWPHGNRSHLLGVHIDEHAPQLDFGGIRSMTVDSDALDNVPVEVTLVDVEAPVQGEITAHWVLLRQGRVIAGAGGQQALVLEDVDGLRAIHAGALDMRPTSGMALASGDAWQVWFSGEDASGRALTGFGTATEPVPVTMRWVAFDPVLASLLAAPYRPSVGDDVGIELEVANIGLLPGNVTVRLTDGEGVVLERAELILEPGQRERLVWATEAWREGDLGLRVSLSVNDVDVPVPLADVSPGEVERQGQGAAWVGLGVIAVVLAMASLLLAKAQAGGSTVKLQPPPLLEDEEE